MKNIVVTGGSGKAGRALVRELLEHNYNVVNVDLLSLTEPQCHFLKADLNDMGQGYKSKILHTLTHFLDGFFGIDTCFYNLEEDSHWLSDGLAAEIKKYPKKFWLLRAKCSSKSGTTDFLERLRRTEGP